jgi:hypothetical protein
MLWKRASTAMVGASNPFSPGGNSAALDATEDSYCNIPDLSMEHRIFLKGLRQFSN